MKNQKATHIQRIEAYNKLAITSKEKAEVLRKKLLANSIFRLIVFLIAAVFAYFMLTKSIWNVAAFSGTMAVFLLLLRRHEKLANEKKRAETVQKIAEDELKAFRHDFSPFDGMAERINPAHDFSFDLDIFGENSIFQLLNRTCTSMGKETLADMLENPLTDDEEIGKRQQAVKELAEKEDFCLQYRIIGMLSDDKSLDENAVRKLGEAQKLFRKPRFWWAAIIVVPALYILLIGLTIAGIISGAEITLLYIVMLAFSSVPMKKVKRIWQLFEKKVKLLESYADLLRMIETEKVESSLLKLLQQSAKSRETSASAAIKQLAQYSRNLGLSFAVPIFLILNPFFLWNVLYALKIEKWMEQHASEINTWFSALAEVDALISLGTFAVNNPDCSYPTFEKTGCFNAIGLRHPLIPRQKCVRNNIEISQTPFFMIVTGANMAGKSTYLRTVGVNHVFAGIGLPVCAEQMSYRPEQLLTNLRTADSLVNSESYFFAELKRLKMIIERLKSNNGGVFIVLDEILKGTNSVDKQKGSFQLMRRLVKLGGNGIIATHDLTLGSLENEFPEAIKNFHFDANIENDVLSFDYKLQRGIAQTMNASFLMKNMGIVE
ncbi:MutS-related protein [Petrimonas sp.]|uniref:MutS-related protein n=1 Tax=Petrimonas sp. TaxID=2023866 RepID=UPI003F50EEF1